MALTGDVANLIVALRLDDKGFTGKLNAAAGRLNQMDRGLSQMGRGAGQLAGGIGRLGTVAAAAAAGGLAAVVTTAASFEQAFTGVEKTVDATDAEFIKLEETLRAMARSMPVAFEELAAIGETGGALGIEVEDLEEFIDVVARLGVTTDLSSDLAATALGHLGTILNLTGTGYEELADSLVNLGNEGASTESQIIDIAERFAAAGVSAGLAKEDILALASVVASVGIDAEAGGSALSRLFNNVATNIGTSSEKAVAFADTLGLSLSEFRDAWETDALGTFNDLLAVINELDQFEGAALLKGLGITNTRDVNAVRLLSQNLDDVNKAMEDSRTGVGALDEESEKFFGTTIGQWGTLKNIVRDAGYVIGKEILPIVNEQMKDFVDFLAKPGTQSGLADFAKDLATGIGDMVQQIRNADFGPLLDTFRIAGGIAKAGFDAFRALPPGVQALALAAIGVNKLSGGALTQIAAGMGNILGGAIKLAIPALNRGMTPLNPMYVKEVGLGGKTGPPIIPTAGLLSSVLTFLAGVVLPVAALAQLSPSSNANNTQQITQQRLVTDLWDRGLLTDTQYQTLFKLAYEGIDISNQLPSDIEVRVAGLNEALAERNAAIPEIKETSRRIREVKDGIDRLPDAAMLAPGVSSLTTNLPQLPSILSEIKGVKGTGQAHLSKTGEALAAVRFGNSTLESIRLKKSSFVVNTTVNTSVSVSASQVAQQVASHTRTVNAGGAFAE